MIRRLALLACVLTIVITAASAFLRHTQAGLGCTPWPACYRDAGAQRLEQGGAATAAQPLEGETDAVFVVRALHRVSAVLVGLLALGIALFGWTRLGTGDRVAAAFALVDTVFLSWLGRYTPHDLPLVTLGNVLGGFALAAAFGWIAAGPRPGSGAARSAMAGARGSGAAGGRPGGGLRDAPGGGIRMLAWTGFALVALQSAAGVMISVRHAVDACADLLCAPSGAPLPGLFDPALALVVSSAADGRPLHLVHRGLAVLVTMAALMVLWRMRAGAGTSAGAASRAVAGAAAGAGTGRRDRRAGAAGVWPLLVLGLLAVAGAATASGAPGNLTGTLHNVLAATLFVLFAALARRTGHDGIDSR